MHQPFGNSAVSKTLPFKGRPSVARRHSKPRAILAHVVVPAMPPFDDNVDNQDIRVMAFFDCFNGAHTAYDAIMREYRKSK